MNSILEPDLATAAAAAHAAPPTGDSTGEAAGETLAAAGDLGGTSGLYRDILDFAHTTPTWTKDVAELWTELGLLVFAALFIAGWWRSRRFSPQATAVAVLAPLVTGVAYVLSETFKSVIQEERPCRAVADAAASLVPCPQYGDWSFPSNHSTIAGAAAIGLALAWRHLWRLTVPMAILMGFSRIFVGVHYPHDVAVGLLFGGLVAWGLVRLCTKPLTRLVVTMRDSGSEAVVWLAGPGAPRHSAGAEQVR
ncbi:phosphatase PAP2 family protein [Streptomyces sp. NPDC058373]|uniref:phosphatase PAP2 family protein n=1 Tax=Streptomyces sp. NPDC058373 TaxID=3346465 RepID=UPI00366851B5